MPEGTMGLTPVGPLQLSEDLQRTVNILWNTLSQPSVAIGIKPKPKARPRVTRRGITYMPKDYVEYCRRVAEIFHAAGGETLTGAPEQPLSIAVQFDMVMPKQKPKSWKIAHAGKPHPLQRGDVDNLAGAVMDAILPKGEMGGDGRVSHLWSWKVWAYNPGVTIWILPLEDAETRS